MLLHLLLIDLQRTTIPAITRKTTRPTPEKPNIATARFPIKAATLRHLPNRNLQAAKPNTSTYLITIKPITIKIIIIAGITIKYFKAENPTLFTSLTNFSFSLFPLNNNPRRPKKNSNKNIPPRMTTNICVSLHNWN
jgi:hypothetical protein